MQQTDQYKKRSELLQNKRNYRGRRRKKKDASGKLLVGLSVDINADTQKCSSDAVYQWLNENAWKYGFIKRYPSDKTDITGISNEPWHYRYVGKEAAKAMKEQNLCLEEYLRE